MKEFNTLATIWKLQPVQKEPKEFKKIRSVRSLLKKRAFWSCAGLISLIIWIGWIGLVSPKNQVPGFSLASIVLIMLILLIQAAFSAFSYFQLAQMHEDGKPSEELQKWNAYYKHRTSYLKNVSPLFFFLLNGAFLLYLPEVLKSYPNDYYKVGFSLIYLLCMGLAWFGPAKVYLKKELDNLEEISSNLKTIFQQWYSLLEGTSSVDDSNV
ncbi:hypothetical protein [Aquiflexum gelatinilyticum]|uniref:hypothetical protein n=1 Tax=Aquiflexum gelatinilyticum TaxID=2961943 RepID=UPI002168DA2D|nr:hypothetical protein [Aquiflexum gelatinilyticum]MCS4435836.1 hypothetical protein [Aquiflexum gelatinilyticum]